MEGGGRELEALHETTHRKESLHVVPLKASEAGSQLHGVMPGPLDGAREAIQICPPRSRVIDQVKILDEEREQPKAAVMGVTGTLSQLVLPRSS